MFRRTLLLAAIVILPAACSGGDDSSSKNTTGGTASATTQPAQASTTTTEKASQPGDSSPIPTSASDRVGCRVKITGAIETEFTGKDDGPSFASDYYASQQEIDFANQALSPDSDAVPPESSVPGEEPDFTGAPRPEGAAPIVSWFLLNCEGGDITLSFYANPDATKDDVPQGPGRYDIVSGQVAAASPRDFYAFVVFGANPPEEVYQIQDGGFIQIARFDEKGAKGSFEFSMKEAGGKELKVKGTFDVTCHSGGLCQAAAG